MRATASNGSGRLAIGELDNRTWPSELNSTGRWSALLPSIPEGHNYLWHTPRNKQKGSEPLFGWRTRYWSFLLKLAKNQPSWTIQAELIPGMDRRPVLDDIRRADAERIAAAIEARVARVDPAERAVVSQKLQRLVDQWASRRDLQTYWDDYNRRTSLLMSAEQFAAKADVDPDLDAEGARRALWPTPNSMREVEPGAPFVLRHVLKTEGS